MNRSSIGIMGLAIFLSLIVGSASKYDTREPSTITFAGSEKAEPALPRRSPRKEQCKVSADSFQSDLIDAVRMEVSRGRKDDDRCPEDYEIPKKYRVDDEGKFGTHILLAIVPDPVHTNLSLLFDQQMDVVQQGVLDSGWIFEKALMPWDNRTHPESSDFRIRLLQEQFEKDQQNLPGLMLFRRLQAKSNTDSEKHDEGPKTAGAIAARQTAQRASRSQNDNGNPRERLLVFVIGESPTGGIQKQQFRQALNLVEQFFLGPKRDPKRPLPDISIVGPTFSGSLHSLAALLDCKGTPSCPCKKVTIMSGTATSESAKAAFHDESGQTIVSLQENDTYAVRQFLNFACKKWHYQPSKIAILSEDETAYGTADMTHKQRSEGAKEDGCKEHLDDGNERQTVHLYFPRDISQLRSAYQRAVAGHSGAKGSIPRSTLPLDLDSSSTDEDTVREYSGKQLPLSQEAIMLAIVGELQAHSTKIVLLRATVPWINCFSAVT